MDIGRARQQHLCYRCDKPGHIARECPESDTRKFNVHALAGEMTREEQLGMIQALMDDMSGEQVKDSMPIPTEEVAQEVVEESVRPSGF